MKIAIYYRVSKSELYQNTERQKIDLREFAKSNEWEVVEEIEEFISGKIKKREGTEKIIHLARSKKIKKVLVHEISRLGRNTSDTLNTIESLIESKCSVYDFSQKQETLDKSNRKTAWATIVLPVLSGMNEYWTVQHSNRIKSGLKKAIKNGKKLGAPNKKKLKNEDKILSYLVDGYSIRNAAKLSNVSPSHVQKIKSDNIDFLNQTTIKSILPKSTKDKVLYSLKQKDRTEYSRKEIVELTCEYFPAINLNSIRLSDYKDFLIKLKRGKYQLIT